jgi:hypothetical protein
MAPDVIRDVLEGVLLLMGQEDTSWAAMKAFLGKRSVKEDIINYDAHRCAAAHGIHKAVDVAARVEAHHNMAYHVGGVSLSYNQPSPQTSEVPLPQHT